MKLLIIYNPNAANGRAKKLIPKIEKAFTDKQATLDFLFTQYRGHGTELTKQVS
ncbi:MAG TPA: diacylglycerol kinase family lipid kinase, partial [Caldithrix abyssi]|nr:diacylglycerol kinase family lipid kinase [Caldithrix abyssi]